MRCIDLARAAKIHKSYVSNIEDGAVPSVAVLKRIAKALKVTVDQLLET